jgi:hypothetical protein
MSLLEDFVAGRDIMTFWISWTSNLKTASELAIKGKKGKPVRLKKNFVAHRDMVTFLMWWVDLAVLKERSGEWNRAASAQL